MASQKENPSVAIRFTGPFGKTRLKEALLRQPLIAGDVRLARKLTETVQLVERKVGKEFTHQGGVDNDIYFILSGRVSIQVNNREIAVRQAGEHVGEMALVDGTARRSASVVAAETCVAARITEPQFSKLAESHPQLWHRVAVTLVQRLRERNKFHPTPHSQPVVFIGSSSEGSRIAECLYNYLLRFPYVPRLWSEGVFEASKTTIEDLVKLIAESDFAIIVLTPDDITAIRGRKSATPRDNAVFELGLFMGGITRERTYIVSPNGVDIKIPTDLLGVTRLLYRHRGKGSLAHRLQPAKNQLRQLIEKHGPR